ncbi:MAG: hypothetical protein QOH55_7 [Microbacteriaceae bacterium]|nr:hypothetical protein [Microbacteriaceae bacterium]
MTNTLSLAARLRTMDDIALSALVADRQIAATGINDFFDLAEALLDRDSIQRALSRLDRQTLAAIAALTTVTGGAASATDVAARLLGWGASPAPDPRAVADRLSRAADLALAERSSENAGGSGERFAGDSGEGFAAYESVREQFAAWPGLGLPSSAELATSAPPTALAAVPDTDARFTDRLAAEHAFAAVSHVSGLVAELDREPARELQKGGLALPATKRLASALSIGLDDVASVLSVAARAGLVAQESSAWLTTDKGAAWQHASTADRWRGLAEAWQQRLPVDIRGLLAERAHAVWGDSLRAFVTWAFPAGGAWMQERVTVYARDAEVLGITARQAPSTPGSLLLENGVDASTAAMAAMFPPEVERVYLQHDLSIVSPGPLTPEIDSRLRMIADLESRALASSYRVSAGSLNRAIAAGESADSIREFLASISLTGLPQPLEYLITDTADRYGRLRVSDLAEHRVSAPGEQPGSDGNSRSSVHSDDQQLLTTVEVDQSLAVLALVRTGPNRLVSRFSRDIVFWALSDARYPVAAEDAVGEVVSLRRHRVALPSRTSGLDPASAIIERLRLSDSVSEAETGEAWLARQLDVAVRGRVTLIVSVAMPDGRLIDYLLEPTGVSGGRLRGRDRKADIERTLPLSSIVSLSPSS